MGRTKQSSGKGYRGSAPKAQLASPAPLAFRSYMAAVQESGDDDVDGPAERKSIFITSNNVFSEFSFRRPTTHASFAPIVSVGRVHLHASELDREEKKDSDLYLRLDFSSVFDGNMTKDKRLPVDIAFVLDVSGSMVRRASRYRDRSRHFIVNNLPACHLHAGEPFP